MPISSRADGVFLLQLGSFGKKSEAQALWSELKSKYPELFGNFAVRFQEVQLPPDDFIVYRTQAGAMEDRESAQTVCDRLNSRGDECYVVETAMFRPDVGSGQEPTLELVNPVTQKPIASAQIPAVPTPPAPEVELEAEEPGLLELLAEPIEPSMAALPEPELPTPPSAINAPATMKAGDVIVATPEVRRIVNPLEEIKKEQEAAANKGLTIDRPAMKMSVREAPAAPDTGAPVADIAQMEKELAALPPVPSMPSKPFKMEVREAPEVQAPEARPMRMPPPKMPAKPVMPTPAPAVVDIPQVEEIIPAVPSVEVPRMQTRIEKRMTQPTPKPAPPRFTPVPRPVMEAKPEDDESFWSMIDPFSSDDEMDHSDQRMEMARMDEEEEESESWLSDMFTFSDEEDVDFPAQPRMPGAAGVPSWQMGKAKAAAPSYTLPPPPAPSSDYAMRAVAQERAQANSRGVVPAAPAVVPAQRPAAVTPLPKAPVPTMGKPVAPAMVGKVPNNANPDVEVAEAIRVPLTQGQAPLIDLSPKYPTAAEMKALGTPSSDPKGRQLWAEIYHFKSEQMALAYWEAFRTEHPSFPAVRVRVTKPYDQTIAKAGGVTLRVGPFDEAAKIADICDEVRTENIACKPMGELGNSGVAFFDRNTYLPSRYDRGKAKQMMATEPMYWVQLGSFDSEGAAKKEWAGLRSKHKPLFDRSSPIVSAPVSSSAKSQVFRLRTGPYAMRAGADSLCQNIKRRGADCMVVFSR